LKFLSQALKVKTSFIVKGVYTAYMESKEPEKEKANDLFAQQVNEMAKAHLKYVAFVTFLAKIHEHVFKDANILPLMELVAKVYALADLCGDCSQCFASGYFPDKSCYDNLHAALKKALSQLRPFMIPLVECMYIPDSTLCSAIGNEWGDIYEMQFERAKNSKLGNSIPPYYKQLIEPILKAPKL